MNDADYTLHPGPPPLEDYLRLRRDSGLTPVRPDQGRGAISGSWSFCHVQTVDGTPVAMGRLLGDGGWYFHVADMATDPAHQRQGLGRAVLDWLVQDVRDSAPEGAYVNLVADPPGVRLYEAVGLRDVAPSTGMAMVVGTD